MKKFFTLSFKVVTFLVLIFAFTVNSHAQPQYYNYNTAAGGNAFPFSVTAGKLIQFLILPGELNQPTSAPSGTITELYFFCATASTTFTNLTIKMGLSTITSLPTGVFYTDPLDTVYFSPSVTLSSTAGTFMGIILDRPHIYDNTQSLIIEVSQCGASATGMTLYTTGLTGNRRTYNQTAGGCNYIYQGQGTQTANCGVDISTAVPSVNRCLLLPTPGVNINYVSIPYQASMVGFGNNITIEAWVKTGGSTTANTVLNKGAASFDYQLGINVTTSNPFFRAGATVVLGNLITIPVNVWTHIAVVSNGTSVVFYVNGIAAQTLPTVTTLGSSTGEMRIGRGNADAGSGRIEELRLWSVARTATDINANKCIKWIPNNTTGLKAIWHFDSTYVDSVSGWNGTVMGTVGFDTVGFCPLVTYVPVTVTNVPDKYTLEQNYPNPFNPLTRINFSLPKNGFVSLKIYDVLGKEVAVLINENKNAGKYIVDFNATSLTSGVYFYKLEVNGFVSTKKMTLIK